MPSAAVPSPNRGRSGRAQARIGLALLEALRDRDRPPEVLDDENVSHTLPRRFGLSDVVYAQIRRYEEDVRRRRRVSEDELRGLFRLVTRRPDAGDVFHAVGRSLADPPDAPVWSRVAPNRVLRAAARRRIGRRLRTLFGTTIVKVSRDPFEVEAIDGLLLEADPGGKACSLVSGLSQAILNAYGQREQPIVHSSCRGRGGDRCAWTLRTDGAGAERPEISL